MDTIFGNRFTPTIEKEVMQEYLYKQLALSSDSTFTRLSKIIYAIIFLSIVSIVLESEITIYAGNESLFIKVNYFFGIIFLIEYCMRLYAIGASKEYAGISGRIKYIFSFYALIDLLAFLPFLLFPQASETFLLRIFRALRLFSMLRTTKAASGFVLIGNVVKDKLDELMYAMSITFGVIFVSAICLYLAEGHIQPDAFGSIPRALWWASSTLTTISYGDVIPVTVLGKILTMIITIASIGIVAIPTGILAAGFSEAMAKEKENK